MNRDGQLAVALIAGGVGAILATRLRAAHKIDFRDRTVLITGGSRGLGLVLARELAAEGARLVLVARNQAELERAGRELESGGAPVLTVTCDVRDRSQAQAAVAGAIDRFGRLDVLINNAGIIQVGPMEHMTLDDYEDAMATHFWGPLYMMEAALPQFRRRGFGRIVNIASIGGKIAVPHMAPYCASKFALVGLSDGFRAELAKDGIQITTVSPGLMRTGSPINASFKGRHRAEFAWFAVSDALPGLSIDARRAARQIIDACRTGHPDLIISLPAQLAVWLNTLFPDAVAQAASLAARVLPPPDSTLGERARTGRESRSAWAPSLLTRLNDKAARRNNQSGNGSRQARASRFWKEVKLEGR